ncbi:MAG: hypothetical protein Q4E22_00605 [Coriobacteriia bacterium]|nr:hypothetical protein [Coriobacteriia bacterium]
MASDHKSAMKFPEIELSSYEPVQITLKKIEISDKDIEDRMRQNANSFGMTYADSPETEVSETSIVDFDLQVDLNGKDIPNLTGKNRMLDLNVPMMPQSFNDEIIGMKVGETKEFIFNTPGNADLESENTTTDFHAVVTINKIKDRVEPEITDEWVKQYIPFVNTVEEFRQQARDEIQSEINEFAKNEKISQAANKLSERFEGKVGDELYKQVMDDLKNTYEQQAQSMGQTLEEALKEQGSSMQQFTMTLMMQARQTVRQGLSLDAWARHYNITPKDNDINMMLETMYPGQGQQMREQFNENPEQLEGLEIAARRYLANMDVVAKAQVVYED